MEEKEILTGPAVGVDCAALWRLPAEEALVMSSDPITGTVTGYRKPLYPHHGQRSGGVRRGACRRVMLTVLLPEDCGRAGDPQDGAGGGSMSVSRLNMEIFGGHTEVTDVGQRSLLISATGVGKYQRKIRASVAGPGYRPGAGCR